MNVKTLAIDLAKRVFFLHEEDGVGRVALRDARGPKSRTTTNVPMTNSSTLWCAIPAWPQEAG